MEDKLMDTQNGKQEVNEDILANGEQFTDKDSNNAIPDADTCSLGNKNSIHKNNKKILIVGAVIIVALVITIICILCANNKSPEDLGYGTSSSGSSATSQSKLDTAYNLSSCDSPWAEIGSDDSYLKIDTNPYNYDSDSTQSTAYLSLASTAIKSINTYLGFSGAVYEKMLSTSSLDGRQTQSNDNYSVSWKYHPDNGLEVIYEWIG